MNEIMIGTWAWGAGYNGSKMVFGKKYSEATLEAIKTPESPRRRFRCFLVIQ